MRYVYQDSFEFSPVEWSVDSYESVLEFLRGHGTAERHGNRIAFQIDSADHGPDFDLWEMRETVGEIEQELSSRGVSYNVDREKLREVPSERMLVS